jgi:hypothetical protein
MLMKPTLPPLSKQAQELKCGHYEHYKGGLYDVLAVARDSADLTEYVVYRALYGDHLTWIRPVSEFCEAIEIHGKIVPRFRRIEKE